MDKTIETQIRALKNEGKSDQEIISILAESEIIVTPDEVDGVEAEATEEAPAEATNEDNAEEVEEVEEATEGEAPAEPRLNAKKTIALISETTDFDKLAEMQAKEDRVTVVDAIIKQHVSILEGMAKTAISEGSDNVVEFLEEVPARLQGVAKAAFNRVLIDIEKEGMSKREAEAAEKEAKELEEAEALIQKAIDKSKELDSAIDKVIKFKAKNGRPTTRYRQLGTKVRRLVKKALV